MKEPDFRGVITEKCIETLRKNGCEILELADGKTILLTYQKKDSGPPPGTRGRGIYVEDKQK